MTATAPSTKNVISAKPKVTGAVFRGPVGSMPTPSDATSAIPEAMKGLGYVSSDGMTETVDRSSKKITAWGGDTVKVVQTEHSVIYKLTLIETGNPEVLKAVYGNTNVSTTPASKTHGTLHKVLINSKGLENATWNFEMAEADATIRVYVPNGQVTSVGDVKHLDEDVVGYEIQIEALPDAQGNKAYKFIDLGDKTA